MLKVYSILILLLFSPLVFASGHLNDDGSPRNTFGPADGSEQFVFGDDPTPAEIASKWRDGQLVPNKQQLQQILNTPGLMQPSDYKLITADMLDRDILEQISDHNLLNPDQLSQAVSREVGATVRIALGGPGQVRLVNGGFEIDQAANVQVGSASLDGATGIKYLNGVLTGNANSMVREGTVTTNVQGLSSDVNEFSIESANTLLAGCVRVDNIVQTTFKVYGNALEVRPDPGQVADIVDCSFNNVQFAGKKLLVSKEIPTIYNIEEGTLTHATDSYTEKLDANSTAVVELDPTHGFACMRINPIGTYWYHHQIVMRNLGINIPQEAESYKLCLKKGENQYFTEYDGLVDFVNKQVDLRKVINYLRIPFTESGQILSLLMEKVYEGQHPNSQMIMDLDRSFIYIDNAALQKIAYDANEKTATLRSGYHELYEIDNTRLLKINRLQWYPDLISSYNKADNRALIVFKNTILNQNGNTKVKALSLRNTEKAELFMQSYWQQQTTLQEHLE